MFSRQTKAPAHPASGAALPDHGGSARKPGPPKAASIIAADITIEGDVSGDGELQLDGVIRGDVRVGRLSVGETGCIEGDVHSEALIVRGRIIGSVTAKQVQLFPTAHVDGDITHEQLVIEAGAYFQGRSLKFQRPTPATPRDPAEVSEPTPRS